MASRARLYYQYFKNRDGSIKSEDEITQKIFQSFTVEELPKNKTPDKIYIMTYTLDDDKEIEEMINILKETHLENIST